MSGRTSTMLGKLQASHSRLPRDEVEVLDQLLKNTKTTTLTFADLKNAGKDLDKMKSELLANPTTILEGTMKEISDCDAHTVAAALATSCVTTIVVGESGDDSLYFTQPIARLIPKVVPVLSAIFCAGTKQLSQLVVTKSGDVVVELFSDLIGGLTASTGFNLLPYSKKSSLTKVIVNAEMPKVTEVTKLVQTAPKSVREVVLHETVCHGGINDMIAFHNALKTSHVKLTEGPAGKSNLTESIAAFQSSLSPADYVPVRNVEALAEDQMAFGVGFNKLIPVTTKGLRHSLVVKGFMDLNLGEVDRRSSGPVSVEDKVVLLDIEKDPPGLLSVQCMACFLDHVATDEDTAEAKRETTPRCHVPQHHFSFLLTLKTAVDGDQGKYTALLGELLQLSIYYNIPSLKRLTRSGLVL